MLKLKLWKVVGIIGSVVMFYVDFQYLRFVFTLVRLFYAKSPDFMAGLAMTVTIWLIPYLLLFMVGGVLFTLTMFFLAPAIDF